jgi:hypothetical protein
MDVEYYVGDCIATMEHRCVAPLCCKNSIQHYAAFAIKADLQMLINYSPFTIHH